MTMFSVSQLLLGKFDQAHVLAAQMSQSVIKIKRTIIMLTEQQELKQSDNGKGKWLSVYNSTLKVR